MLFLYYNSFCRNIKSNMSLAFNSNNFIVFNFVINNVKLFSYILSLAKIKYIFMIHKSFHNRNIMNEIIIYCFCYNSYIITFLQIFNILLRVHSTLKFFFTIFMKNHIIIHISTNKGIVYFIVSTHFI